MVRTARLRPALPEEIAARWLVRLEHRRLAFGHGLITRPNS
jgi:hypothetical protein